MRRTYKTWKSITKASRYTRGAYTENKSYQMNLSTPTESFAFANVANQNRRNMCTGLSHKGNVVCTFCSEFEFQNVTGISQTPLMWYPELENQAVTKNDPSKDNIDNSFLVSPWASLGLVLSNLFHQKLKRSYRHCLRRFVISRTDIVCHPQKSNWRTHKHNRFLRILLRKSAGSRRRPDTMAVVKILYIYLRQGIFQHRHN